MGVSGDVLVNPPGFVIANNSPTGVPHPAQPNNLVVSHRIDRPGFDALVQWSNDGGASWQPTELPLPPATPACAASPEQTPCPFAPDVAFGPDGTLYVLYVHLEGRGNTPAALWLARSHDATAASRPPRASRVSSPSSLVLPSRATAPCTWCGCRQATSGLGTKRLVGSAVIVASSSADGGTTSPNRCTSVIQDATGAGAQPGRRLGWSPRGPLRGFQGRPPGLRETSKDPHPGPFSLVVSRSDARGKSFSPGVELEAGIVASERFLVFLPERPSLDAGPGGLLYAAWHDARNGDDDVFLRRSEDGGATWSEVMRVNDNPLGDGTDQYLPKAAVAPDGRIDVVFYDRRADPANIMTEAYLASSVDGGASFTNLAISPTSFSSEVGPSFGEFYGTDFGTRLALSSDEGSAVAAWTDTRLGNQANGRQDIFATTVVGLASPGRSRGCAALRVVARRHRGGMVHGERFADGGTTFLIPSPLATSDENGAQSPVGVPPRAFLSRSPHSAGSCSGLARRPATATTIIFLPLARRQARGQRQPVSASVATSTCCGRR